MGNEDRNDMDDRSEYEQSGVWSAWFCVENLMSLYLRIVLATGPGNPPVLRLLTCGSVRFRLQTRPKTRPAWSWPGCYQDRTSTHGCLAQLYPDRGSVLPFLQLWLQISNGVLIVSWHDQYVDCTELTARLPPTFRLAIRPIVTDWVWKNAQF